MKSSLIIHLLLLFLVFIAACSTNNEPEDLIPEEQYMEVFLELVLINQQTDEQLEDVSRDSLIEQTFERYGVTEDQFNRSHTYYQRQPEQQIERLEKMEEKLTTERDTFREQLDENQKAPPASTATPDTLQM